MGKKALIDKAVEIKTKIEKENGVKKPVVTKKDAGEWIDALSEAIVDLVCAGESVRIPNFGIFEPGIRPAHLGTNPGTGEVIKIPDVKTFKFKVSKVVKDKVNKK